MNIRPWFAAAKQGASWALSDSKNVSHNVVFIVGQYVYIYDHTTQLCVVSIGFTGFLSFSTLVFRPVFRPNYGLYII
jgi:hypothetical protein